MDIETATLETLGSFENISGDTTLTLINRDESNGDIPNVTDNDNNGGIQLTKLNSYNDIMELSMQSISGISSSRRSNIITVSVDELKETILGTKDASFSLLDVVTNVYTGFSVYLLGLSLLGGVVITFLDKIKYIDAFFVCISAINL